MPLTKLGEYLGSACIVLRYRYTPYGLSRARFIGKYRTSLQMSQSFETRYVGVGDWVRREARTAVVDSVDGLK